MNKMHFTFSDVIAGYVTSVDAEKKVFGLKTTDEREFQVKLTDATYGEMVRNLGESFQSPPASLEDTLKPGGYLFAYGVFYPENDDYTFEAKHLIFMGRDEKEYLFEAPDWWLKQIRSLAEFYLHAQFPDGKIDFNGYRTELTLEGQKIESTRQETDTISRMIYGFATAYMLTGDERFLDVAEKGTQYLHDHMRAFDEKEGIVYWYHGIDRRPGKERKILASQFGDDYDAIPAYEQIYALAGPVQTYRVTGDLQILHDVEMTLHLFDKFFLDREKGGYFSHIDPVTFNPRADSLDKDRARKNWNSVGDHAPAYLINLWLATGEEKYADLLTSTADTIVAHFPDYEHSPFVQERFHEDWAHDTTWGWQQNRAVAGHNLKIAWNLMRINHLRPHQQYTDLAQKIAEIMPTVGMDKQHGGWYDVVERLLAPGEEWYRYVWHDRKAWWQQEQGILAYLILHGSLKKPEYQRLGRESVAFYNAFFPDHDNGGVYFNVLANGIPYLLETERLKGSHSMSGYHSFELCYLATVYTNLLSTNQPLDLYFRPKPDSFKENILRVQPDILPPGSVKIEEVWVNGVSYTDFDPVAMTIKLPTAQSQDDTNHRPNWASPVVVNNQQGWKVRVRLIPAALRFDTIIDTADDLVTLTINGDLDDADIETFKTSLDKIVEIKPKHVVIHMEKLNTMSLGAARTLSFVIGKLDLDEQISLAGANDEVKSVLQEVQLLEEVNVVGADDSTNVRQEDTSPVR